MYAETRSESWKRLLEGDISICVVGLGRIGLPTATLFAEAGARVLGADINQELVASLNSQKCQLTDEDGLPEMFSKVVAEGKLWATTHVSEAVSSADVIIICVPTPVDSAKVPNYSYVEAASHDIGKGLKPKSLVVVESTVGPGIVEDFIMPILEADSGLKAGLEFGLVSCPERADPGKIIQHMKEIPKIIGGIDPQSTEAAASLYENALGVKVVRVSDPKTANAIKLTENLFRDVNIALANEFAVLYERLGVDMIEVIKGCSTKYNFMPHYPGPGVGGPCLPSNPYYLIVESLKVGNIPHLIRLAREINDAMPDHVVDLISGALNDAGKTLKGSTISLLGLSYKPEVKDIQQSPMEKVLVELLRLGATVRSYDPMYKGEVVFGVKVEDTLQAAVEGSDCVVIGTLHKEFENLNLDAFVKTLNMPAAIVDTRNALDPGDVINHGFAYRGVGRPVGKWISSEADTKVGLVIDLDKRSKSRS